MKNLKQWLNALQLSLFDDERDAPPQQSVPAQPIESPAKTRTIVLNNQAIPYTIERVRRRTVGMVIDVNGLRVRASARVSLSEIERILRSKESWILKSLHKQSQSLKQPQSFVPDLNMADGAVFTLLGRTTVVCWVESAPVFNAADFWQQHQTELRLQNVSDGKRAQKLLDAVVEVLQFFLEQQAQAYVQRFNLHYRQILLSSAKTLWGTCRTDGVIRINWRLAFLSDVLADYVLVHELAHTVHMNHSKQFWAQVQLMCPEYKKYVRQMKQYNLRAA